MIPLSKPNITKREEKAVLQVLRSGMLAQGTWVHDFENQFAAYVGTKYAIATSSGTTALHLALLALGIGPGDEVITSSFTFIASANAILYTGAKPVFADIEEHTYTIDPKSIEEKITPKTRAIIPIHLYGLSCNMKAIMKIAKKHNLFVIEDACQAHGAAIEGKKVGSFGTAGVFSFYPTKNMTTGEGGMITTNNRQLAQKIQLLREHGMKIRYHHDIVGYNFRMTNIGGSIGQEQLKKLDFWNEKRIRNALFLIKHLNDIPGIITPTIPQRFTHVFHQFTIRITSQYKRNRQQTADFLKQQGIATGIYYPIPVHKQKIYEKLEYKDTLPVTEKLANEVLSLPVNPFLQKKDLKKIILSLH